MAVLLGLRAKRFGQHFTRLRISKTTGTNEALALEQFVLTIQPPVTRPIHPGLTTFINPDGITPVGQWTVLFSFWRNDMSTFADNAARFPLQVGTNLAANPGRVNDESLEDLESVAKILVRAGQRTALEAVVLADGVSASAKGVIARVLDKSKQRLH
ncbi:hypothetical protein LJR118_006584 [Acidovorax sp. LjRoot118]|uniref:hypothetical protein n=1 Tax=Acidovorax sp. LjRoot118 TaxID=3342256 RepID=UPI003ECCC61E